jgi:putative Mn2+ efflux pump MntP
VLALILVAISVGFSNLAASVGVGVGGVDRGTRLRVIVIFGLLEAGMPVVGLVIGHGLAAAVGRETRWFAAGLLTAVGGYGIVTAWRQAKLPPGQRPANHGARQSIKLFVSGLALSLDNLIAGFALGAFQVGIVTGAVVFGVVSVAMSLVGLELGARIGNRSGQRGEIIGGVVLIGVGAAIGFGAIG